MSENYDCMSDETIFENLKKLMTKLDKDQELQDLAERNGLDVKNALRLSPTTKDNVAVAMVSLMLAKKYNDPKYGSLVRTGLEKRQMKASLINDYKDQAQRLIQKYRDNNM